MRKVPSISGYVHKGLNRQPP